MNALKGNHIEYYFEMKSTMDFAYKLFCLTRGVKTSETIDGIKTFIIQNTQTKLRAVKLKEIICIIINEFV
jgi:hypothetical protein